MTEHTPGPWEAQESTVYQIDGYGLCYVEGKRAEADARLIAAAPDMKEALEGVMRMTFEDLSAVESGEIIEAAVRSLAKARGEDWPTISIPSP